MRPIDANLAIEQIKKSDLSNREKVAMLLCLSSIPTISPPPNDPLSLEELREMEGKPVWVVGVSYINDFNGHYDIFELVDGRMLFCVSLEEPDIDNYDPAIKLGVAGWRAYRRKPEEEQHGTPK